LDDILKFITEILSQGILLKYLNEGKIVLIPKSGELSYLTNFRPIILLTSLYKIIAKFLANRMTPNLTTWILPSQTGFVPNRCIFNNIYLAYKSMKWAEESHQNLVLLLMDFDKAYDRVSWSFLTATMYKMGFSQQWNSWIMSLNHEATTTVTLHGTRGQNFNLQRSVRQGCPLAPYLFLANVIAHMLQDPKYEIQGLQMPDESVICSQMFADDTILFLEGTTKNLENVMHVFNIYSQVSGAKVNWHKSRAIWASRKPKLWTWGEDLGLI
jgi:hypothetical protein